jgi:hypothetical protein
MDCEKSKAMLGIQKREEDRMIRPSVTLCLQLDNKSVTFRYSMPPCVNASDQHQFEQKTSLKPLASSTSEISSVSLSFALHSGVNCQVVLLKPMAPI